MPDEERITATPAARAELALLCERHGLLILFLSGGCCEGSSPLCLHEDELPIGPNDLRLGELAGVPVYILAEQDRRWNAPRFLLDVSPGESDTFSLENADRLHFVVRGGVCAAHVPSR